MTTGGVQGFQIQPREAQLGNEYESTLLGRVVSPFVEISSDYDFTVNPVSELKSFLAGDDVTYQNDSSLLFGRFHNEGAVGAFSGTLRLSAALPPATSIAGLPVPTLRAVGRGTLAAVLIGAAGGFALARRRIAIPASR